ncbi:MAG: phosphate ABC transporter permease PstA [Planctomycetaceae bacterium]
MTAVLDRPKPESPKPDWSRRTQRERRSAQSLVARGESMLWLTGGALALSLFMIAGLISLIVAMGVATFWPAPVVSVRLLDGNIRMGEVSRNESFTLTPNVVSQLPEASAASAAALLSGNESHEVNRRLIRTGNFDLSGTHFESVSDFEIAPGGETRPEWAVVVERIEWGRFYGEPVRFIVRSDRTVSGEEEQLAGVATFLESYRDRIPAERHPDIDAALGKIQTLLREARRRSIAKLETGASATEKDGRTIEILLEGGDGVAQEAVPPDAEPIGLREVWSGSESAWREYSNTHGRIAENRERLHGLEKEQLGRINGRLEKARLHVRSQELATGLQLLAPFDDLRNLELQIGEVEKQRADAGRFARLAERWLADASTIDATKSVVASLNAEFDQQIDELKAQQSAAIAKRNELPAAALSSITDYSTAIAEANEQTARIMQDIDLIRRENAHYELVMKTAQGQEQSIQLANIVRAYRANQLTTGDKLALYGSRWWEYLTAEPREANSEGGVFPAIWGTVVMTLVMSFAVAPFGVLAALYLREYAKAGAMVSAVRIAVNNLAGVPSIVFGVFGLGFFCYVIGASIDEVFFAASLPNPTFGKGGLLWASLTLALMTLPVVIVATEEALAAVPNSMREGSYACGASKWQTIRRIVLPRAMPGIMTGMILAMARGAGEVAPLMLVGAVKLAPELPFDTVVPFIHPERSFMHLGFHIFDLGFQSQNSEAAKPMVFTTTLLLIAIIGILNLAAIWLRGRLRRKFLSAQF